MTLEVRQAKGDPEVPPLPTGTRTIVSIFPRPAFNKNLPFISVEMPACPKCETHEKAPCRSCGTYAKLVVTARREAIDSPLEPNGSGRRLHVLTADEVAEGLVNEACLDRGVFIAAGDEPTAAEIELAHVTYAEWGTRLIQVADDEYSRTGKNDSISPHAHDVALYLGLTRPWLSDTSARQDCVGCGDRVKPGAIMCKCGFPINWEKARKLGKVNAEMEAYGVEEGLLTPRDEKPAGVPVAASQSFRPRGTKTLAGVDGEL